MFFSLTRFILGKAIKVEFILNSELEVETNHSIFNIYKNLVIKIRKDFIVRQLLGGISNLIFIFITLGMRTVK
jgi:hypothetical protein